MNDFKKSWQRSVDGLGEDWSTMLRITFYALSIWYALLALLAPVSDYCYIGSHQFYKLWQKLCFSAGAGSVSFGLYKLGRSYRTTANRNRY